MNPPKRKTTDTPRPKTTGADLPANVAAQHAAEEPPIDVGNQGGPEPAAAIDVAELLGKLDGLLRRVDALVSGGPGPVPRFLDIGAAAAYASLSRDSIRRLIDRGDLTPHRPVRGKILIDREELDRLILGSTDRPRNGRGQAPRDRGDNGRYLGNEPAEG